MGKPSIIIIGAGASGLMAAKELSGEFVVTVLEAEATTGGRLQTVTDGENIIEAGAEFIHGDLPVTLGLLKDAGIGHVKVGGKMYFKKQGTFEEIEEMADGWDGMLDKMKRLEEDMTLHEFLHKFFPGSSNSELREGVESYAEGFDVADVQRVSVKSLHSEWSAESSDNYRIPGGYSMLTQYLQQQAESGGAQFHTRTPVTQITWRAGNVTVESAGGQKYTADKLLVTVPVSVLQQPNSKAYLNFDPPIHFDAGLANDIGFGAALKVVLKFKNIFWQKDAGFVFSDELIPTWWTQLPDKLPIITGWVGGPAAGALSGQTSEALVDLALSSLASIYERPLTELKKELTMGMVFNWQTKDYVMGAYNYQMMSTQKAIKIISTPLEQTIFFAGEALYSGRHPGTVEAALVSGRDTAALIKASTPQTRSA